MLLPRMLRESLHEPFSELDDTPFGSARREFARLQAWSDGLALDEIFDKIYAEGKWGRSPSGAPFYSGEGSLPEFTEAYEELVIDFVVGKPEIRTIVDLGCGDFQVADRILNGLGTRSRPVCYVGCDIARTVIAHNRTANARPGVTFVRANIVEGDLPPGDIALVRQVLQHLTNDDIAKALANIQETYPVAIVTESLPKNRRASNVDIVRGIATRVPLGSGVYLDEPPFTVPIDTTLDVDFSDKEFIRSSVTKTERFSPPKRVGSLPATHSGRTAGRSDYVRRTM